MKTPRTTGEKKTIETARKILKEEKWVKRQQLAKKINQRTEEEKNTGTISESTAAANLSIFSKYMEKQGFERDERAENQGRETVYWRLDK